MLRLGLGLTLFTVLGCARTEVVVTVDATELSIPDEVDHIVFTITNPITDPGGKAPVFVSPQIALCPTGQPSSSTCTSLPTALTLFPGNDRPHDSVRVQLDALRQGTVVISQASVFSFTSGERSKLTFDLYRDCLQLECAQFDQGCASGGVCRNVMPLGPSTPDMGPSSVKVVGVSVNNITQSPTFDVRTPDDVQAGDLLIMAFASAVGGEPPMLVAPGWQRLTWLNTPDGLDLWMLSRIASATEPDMHTFSFVGTQTNFINSSDYLFHFRGATKIEGLRTQVEIGSPSLPSVNIDGPGRLLVAVVLYPNVFVDRTCQPPSGMQVIANDALVAFTQSVPGPAMSGERALLCGQPNENYGVVAFALAP